MNMSCNDVASILDTHRSARLAPAERAQVDAHLAACAACTAAWDAQSGLLALRVPPVPATLLERALLASRLPQSAPVRRARMPIIVGSVLLAGAALAAGVTIANLVGTPPAPAAPAIPADAAAPRTTADDVVERAQTELPSAPSDGAVSVDHVSTSLQLVPVVRVGPEYPAAALEKGVEGSVTMKFTVTATGLVEDLTVVESTDAVFEPSALQAVSAWRYLPRIVAGQRADTADIRTTINFRLQRTATPSPTRPSSYANSLDPARQQAISESVWERLMRDDLRGAELALDELRATYQLTESQLGETWNMYAYLYTLQGSYDRAIDAYEAAIATFARGGRTQGRWVELANLYFARHQYDFALRTLLRSRPTEDGAARPWSPEATELIAKLRTLGVTEETLR
jgi:TonB family protein